MEALLNDPPRQPGNLRKSDFSIFTSIRYDPILAASDDNEAYSNRRKCKLYLPELHRQRLWKAAYKFWPTARFKELETTTAFETALLQAIEEREKLHETFICPMKIKYSFTSSGRTTVELQPVPALPLDALFPSTLKLPSERHSPSRGSRFGSPSSHSPSRGTRFGSPSSYSPSSSRRGSEDYYQGSTYQGSIYQGSTYQGSTSQGSNSPTRQTSLLACTYEIWIDSQPTEQTAHTSFKTSQRPQYNDARMRSLPSPEDYTQEVLLWNSQGLITEGSVLTPYFYRHRRWVTPAVESDGHGGQQGTSRRWALERGLCEEGLINRKSIRVGERVWLSNGVRGFGWGRIQAVKRGDSSSENSF